MTLDIMDGDLWQWDTGREVEAVGCEQVHFAKSTAGTCYTVEVAGGKAKIPDELLQAAGRVYAWAYITDEGYGGRTRIEALWDVKRRAKPAEYIYEPSDQRTIKDAEPARAAAPAAAPRPCCRPAPGWPRGPCCFCCWCGRWAALSGASTLARWPPVCSPPCAAFWRTVAFMRACY